MLQFFIKTKGFKIKFIDISRVHQAAPIYPQDPQTTITLLLSIKNGDECNVSQISTCSHSGTHADAFSHYLEDGLSIDKMPLSHYFGACKVIDIGYKKVITKKSIGSLKGLKRVLFKNSQNSYLSEKSAKYLIKNGVVCVGTEALSIAPSDNEKTIHSILMNGGVAILENLILLHVEPKKYTISAFPIKYGGCDGAPIRAVLLNKTKK